MTARRLVVVSPHLDDAVFSLGSTIAACADAGTARHAATRTTRISFEQGMAKPSQAWQAGSLILTLIGLRAKG